MYNHYTDFEGMRRDEYDRHCEELERIANMERAEMEEQEREEEMRRLEEERLMGIEDDDRKYYDRDNGEVING